MRPLQHDLYRKSACNIVICALKPIVITDGVMVEARSAPYRLLVSAGGQSWEVLETQLEEVQFLGHAHIPRETEVPF